MWTMPTAVRRAIIAVLLLIVAASVYGLTQLKSGPNVASSEIIESISPADGEKMLQQGQITIDLLSGWDGKLSIDQKAIPDDQLVKVKEQGLIEFQPGTGKALEYFPAGQNCAELTYWQTVTPDQTFTKQWCFTSV
jgi:hypothetical protein